MFRIFFRLFFKQQISDMVPNETMIVSKGSSLVTKNSIKINNSEVC